MPFITESEIENYTLELLEAQGWRCVYGPSVAPGGENPLRPSFEDALLPGILEDAIGRINPGIPGELREASTLRAAGFSKPPKISGGLFAASPPAAYGFPDVKAEPFRDCKSGIIWHTQGSGKSLSMVFFTGKIILARDIHKKAAAFQELKLIEYAYAFYTAVADNKSARELMGARNSSGKWRRRFTKRYRKTHLVDWIIREDVRAKLRVTVKRLLREYG
jgi:type I site-specific restriction-modification system R (restriction) subunit